MQIEIAELSLVILIGASGSGKSTFGRTHFLPTEVVSSDFCRAVVSNDENDQSATDDAFELLHRIVATRLKRGLLTVVDATNVQEEARAGLLKIARDYHVRPVAIVFDMPESLCHERNASREDRQFGPHVIRNQCRNLRRSYFRIQKDFRSVYVFKTEAEVAAAQIVRTKMWNDRKELNGPFDIIGDVHGCYDELVELLEQMGYQVGPEGEVVPPEGRQLIFVGDLVDRGPKSPEVLRLVSGVVREQKGLCVLGNHDIKLLNHLSGRKVTLNHGLDGTVAQLEAHPPEFREQVRKFLNDLVSHYVLDGGKLVVAHAGLKEEMHGRASGAVKEFCLYGDTTGEIDEFGLPVRYPWAVDYRGKAMVVYGHTPVPRAEWVNNTIDIDTGCAFGGRLTALRYPERTLVAVPARAEYAVSKRPINFNVAESTESNHVVDDVLDYEDISGKRLIDTRLRERVTIQEENAAAAIEVISRFAVDPRWLVYLPPTMSPSETSQEPGYLEYPTDAFEFYRSHGVAEVCCQEKHMGSRTVVVITRGPEVAARRFGVSYGTRGVVLTRTGRSFFDDREIERQLLDRLDAALIESGTWDFLSTDWLVLDCELMPWSAKAQELLRKQYAPVGSAALKATLAAQQVLDQAQVEGLDDLRLRIAERVETAQRYNAAYRRYCWPVHSLEDFRLAPFHVLAGEGTTYLAHDHRWQMETIGRFTGDGLFFRTDHRFFKTNDEVATAKATEWWLDRTSAGGEGMVIKPLDFIATGSKGLLQPALKCRGREYLRIIYGPEYTESANLDRLRKRRLGGKRSLALREFALGVEALERFVRHDSLRRVHECVFGVLALESEPIDPRL